MKQIVCMLLAGLAISAAPATQTFSGVITDDMCANNAGHKAMRMGPTDAECARACVTSHGASFVLYDGKNIYTLTDQQSADRFAGQKVKVAGTLDAKTKRIQVTSITAAR